MYYGRFQLTVHERKQCFTRTLQIKRDFSVGFFVVVVMYAKTYSCSDFLYAKMKAPELQAREGLVSRAQEPGYTTLCKQTGVFESRPRGVCKCIYLSKQTICSYQ